MLTDLIVIGAKVSSEPKVLGASRGLSFVIPSWDAAMLCAYAAIGIFDPRKQSLTFRPVRGSAVFKKKKQEPHPRTKLFKLGRE
jgi:hypothetical protein